MGLGSGQILDSANPFWGLLVLSSAIRLGWESAELLHGAGHTLVRGLVDGDASVLRWDNLLEHRTAAELICRLLPLAPIGLAVSTVLTLPWLELGAATPWRVRLKAGRARGPGLPAAAG